MPFVVYIEYKRDWVSLEIGLLLNIEATFIWLFDPFMIERVK